MMSEANTSEGDDSLIQIMFDLKKKKGTMYVRSKHLLECEAIVQKYYDRLKEDFE